MSEVVSILSQFDVRFPGFRYICNSDNKWSLAEISMRPWLLLILNAAFAAVLRVETARQTQHVIFAAIGCK
jgi:hypothetical protein